MTKAERARRALAGFTEALARFDAHPTTETFRDVQLAGRVLDDVRQTVAPAEKVMLGIRSPLGNAKTVTVTLGQYPGS